MANESMQNHKQWILIAEEDLGSAKHLFKVPFMTGFFHIQQAAEKALKAYIILKRGSVTKTHDLVRLVDICIEIDRNFESLRLFAAVLTPYEVAGRYPETNFVRPSIEEMQDLIAQAEFIFNFVIHRV